MKIIHCADIHADSKMDSNFSKEQAAIRRKEVVETFFNMVKFAAQNDVRAIIIAGDLFDIKSTQQKSIKNQIAYIIEQNPKIDFLYLRGNHDEDVDFAVAENLPNLKRFSKNEWTQYRYENVVIYGREFSDKIPLNVYSELTLNSKDLNIVALHGQIAEYRTKNGAPAISLPKLQNKNIDYIAFGHIHDYKFERLDSRTSWCYSGCLEGRGFDENGEKGFVLLEIEGEKIKSKFVPAAKRKIHEIHVKLEGSMTYSEIMKRINEKLRDIPKSDIVQIVLEGEIAEDTEIETDSYKSVLENNFFYIRFKDNTEPKIDFEKYEKDISLKGEFIRLVNEQKISAEEKSKIIMLGIKALAGRLSK